MENSPSSLPLSAQIEAILFWKGEAVSRKKLADILKVSKSAIDEGLIELEKNLAGTSGGQAGTARGLVLVQKEDEVMLGTSPAVSAIIEQLTKDELTRDLGKAGLETLSIVLYRGPCSRREIDHIRGVNSTFILRNLLIRGLVEKVNSPTDQRSFLYKPTMELITFMGLTKLEDLPEFDSMRDKVAQFEKQPEEPQEVETTE